MPQWLHDRAKHILTKSKGMPTSEAFAIATQQSHALGKSPKSYGTVRGREEAKEKYKTPEDDQKTASFEQVRVAAFSAELEKLSLEIRKAYVPGMGPALDGKYFNAKEVASHPILQHVAKGRPHLLVVKPEDELRKQLENSPFTRGNPELAEKAPKALQKNLTRHELTHYLRGKAGKLEGVGSPGLRNVASTAREELIANIQGQKAYNKFPTLLRARLAANVPAQVAGSVQGAYAGSGGVLHNALGGTLKPYADKARSLAGKLVKRGEFKLQGSMEHQGIPIAIENRKGSVRKGVDKDGKPWRTKMVHPYGYIKGSKGADGEEVDAYVGPHEEATHAYVVHQHKSDGKGYDEDKVMLGFPSKEHAIKGYLKHYNSDKFLGPVKEVPIDRLKEMLQMKKKLVKISGLACADELLKLGAVTDEQAQRALDRYETLDKQRPTLKQVGRYAALGAAAGPAAHVIGNLGRGKGLKGAIDVSKDVAGKAMAHGRLRTVAGTAAAGAVTTGVVPFARLHLDRSAERGTLRKYLNEQDTPKVAHKLKALARAAGRTFLEEDGMAAKARRLLGKEKDSAMSGITPAKSWAANESADLGKYGFAMSQYSSGQGSPRFKQESASPPFRMPSLRSPVPEPTAGIVEKMGMSATPLGTLSSAKRVGLPRVTNVSGPSIASQVGHAGRVLPGAGKGGIGKGGVSIGSSAGVM